MTRRPVLDSTTKAAVRHLLRSAQEAATPEVVPFEVFAAAPRVLVLRSGSYSTLASFVDRLALAAPQASVTVLCGPQDPADVRRVCSRPVETLAYPDDGNFKWTVIEAALPDLRGRYDAFVFLSNNETASGYENVLEILRRWSQVFYAFTIEGQLLSLSSGQAAALRARDRLAAGLADWYWELLAEGDRP